MAPDAPLGLVASQHPGAGAGVAPGTPVTFYVPEATTVPHLLGKTRNQAISLLQQAGLNAAPQGPAFGLGSTKVVSQSHPAGGKVAKGSTVTFAYAWTGGLPVPKVSVPNLVGLTKNAAQNALAAKGLAAQFQGPAFGFGATQVTAQNPGAGTLVPKGSAVLVVYKFTGGLQPIKVAVPLLIGLKKSAAEQAISAKGLVPQLQGPGFGIGQTKVTSQDPVAGTLVAPGSIVKATYVWTGGIQPLKVTVPSVVNLKPSEAKAALQAKGLNGVVVGPQIGIGKPYVFSQDPAAGAKVVGGPTVFLKLKWKPF
jgi:beta-lactam-binding protein with PASTA domain